MDEAFAVLRRDVRCHNLLLSEVARRVIGQDLAAGPMAASPAARVPGLTSGRACGAALLVAR